MAMTMTTKKLTRLMSDHDAMLTLMMLRSFRLFTTVERLALMLFIPLRLGSAIIYFTLVSTMQLETIFNRKCIYLVL